MYNSIKWAQSCVYGDRYLLFFFLHIRLRYGSVSEAVFLLCICICIMERKIGEMIAIAVANISKQLMLHANLYCNWFSFSFASISIRMMCLILFQFCIFNAVLFIWMFTNCSLSRHLIYSKQKKCFDCCLFSISIDRMVDLKDDQAFIMEE